MSLEPTRWPTSPKPRTIIQISTSRGGKCKVETWTHKISGLTESDFYLAAKVDRAFKTSGMS